MATPKQTPRAKTPQKPVAARASTPGQIRTAPRAKTPAKPQARRPTPKPVRKHRSLKRRLVGALCFLLVAGLNAAGIWVAAQLVKEPVLAPVDPAAQPAQVAWHYSNEVYGGIDDDQPEPEPLPSTAEGKNAAEELAVAHRQLVVHDEGGSSARMVWPIGSHFITSAFGDRIDPVNRVDVRRHRGVDIRSECGTPVVAASAGRVLFAGATARSGNVIRIDHGGMITRYAHLSQLDVSDGDFVRAGERIGLSGSTGRTTGPHLHFEIWTRSGPQDPLLFRYRHLGDATFAAREGASCGVVTYVTPHEVHTLAVGRKVHEDRRPSSSEPFRWTGSESDQSQDAVLEALVDSSPRSF